MRAAASRRPPSAVAVRVLVWVGLAGFVAAVYVLVVVGGGSLVGRTRSPDATLSVLATAAVALGFSRVQSRLEDVARRLLQRGAPTPYEVLRRFSSTVDAAGAPSEVPAQMARLLAQGTGAQWAQVWLVVQDRLTLAATWPPEASADAAPPDLAPGARDATAPGRRALMARHGGQGFGVLRLQEHLRRPLSAVEERLFAGLAGQAGPGPAPGRARGRARVPAPRAGAARARAARVPGPSHRRPGQRTAPARARHPRRRAAAPGGALGQPPPGADRRGASPGPCRPAAGPAVRGGRRGDLDAVAALTRDLPHPAGRAGAARSTARRCRDQPDPGRPVRRRPAPAPAGRGSGALLRHARGGAERRQALARVLHRGQPDADRRRLAGAGQRRRPRFRPGPARSRRPAGLGS